MLKVPCCGNIALLDRERSFADIEKARREARDCGQPAVHRIVARSGYGKSAFLRHLVGHGDTVMLANARAIELQSAFAVAGALAQDGARQARLGLRRYADGLEKPLSALVPDWESRDENSSPSAEAIVRAFTQFVAAIAAERRVILAVDDFQWIDAWSLTALERLAHWREAPLANLEIIVTDRRLDDLAEPWNRRVVLDSLRGRSAERLVRDRYPEARDEVVAEVVACCKGVPFNLIAIAQGARERGVDQVDELDGSLEHLVASRLDRMRPLTRELIVHAARISDPIDVRLLRLLVDGEEALNEALADSANFLEQDGFEVHFLHATLSEAVNSTIAFPLAYDRAVLTAQRKLDDTTMDGTRRIAELALRCGERAVAADHFARFARLSVDAGSVETAVTFYARALALAGPAVPAEILVGFAATLRLLDRDDEAMPALREALDRAFAEENVDDVLSIFRALALCAITIERFESIDPLTESVCLRLERLDLEAGKVAREIGREMLMLVGADAGLSDVDLEPGQRPLSYRSVAISFALRGDAERSRRAWYRWTELAPGAPAQNSETRKSYDGMVALQLGLFERGAGVLGEWWARDGMRLLATDAQPANVCNWALAALFFGGRWNEMGAVFDEAMLEGVPPALVAAAHAGSFAASAIRRTAPVVAPGIIDSLRESFALGRPYRVLASALWLLIAQKRAGKPVPADLVLGVATRIDAHEWGAPLAVPFGAVLFEREFGAAGAAGRSIRAYRAYASTWHRVQADLADAMLARDHSAIDAVRSRFDALGAPGMSLVASLELKDLRPSDMAAAAGCGFSTERRASIDLRRSMTRREREVAELVARGFTNREIASALVVSERTVEVHLTNTFAKLGLRSRTELIASLLGVSG